MKNNKLEQVYIEYHREVYLYAYSLCREHHEAQDLTSDTFYKALLSSDKDKPHIKYWLFRVCKNLFLDGVRKNKEYTSIDNENILITENTPLDKIIDNEERRELYNKVMKLKPSYREIIILFHYCDLNLNEIAKITGLSYGGSKTLIFRARKKLKTRLEEDHEI